MLPGVWCAMLSEENTCQAIRDALLNFEYTNAVPHSIHFLMVTCFSKL
jgi:hypothetical protein